jgi:hypothetical protein
MFSQAHEHLSLRVLEKERRVDVLTDEVRRFQLQLFGCVDGASRLMLQHQVDYTKADLTKAEKDLVELKSSFEKAQRSLQELLRTRTFPSSTFIFIVFGDFPPLLMYQYFLSFLAPGPAEAKRTFDMFFQCTDRSHP